jgi:hypothetical protein
MAKLALDARTATAIESRHQRAVEKRSSVHGSL